MIKVSTHLYEGDKQFSVEFCSKACCPTNAGSFQRQNFLSLKNDLDDQSCHYNLFLHSPGKKLSSQV